MAATELSSQNRREEMGSVSGWSQAERGDANRAASSATSSGLKPILTTRAQSATVPLTEHGRTRVFPAGESSAMRNGGAVSSSSLNNASGLAMASTSSLGSVRSGHQQSWPDFGSMRAARYRVSSSGITFSEAKGEIYKERLHGPLLKRGFRHRRLWVARWVVLTGRMLTYFEQVKDETKDHKHARGSLELTADTVVSYEEDDRVFGFLVFPRGNKHKDTAAAATLSPSSTQASPSSVDLMPIARQEDGSSSGHPPTVLEEEGEEEEDHDDASGSFLSCGPSSSMRRRRSLPVRKSSSAKPSGSGWFPWLWSDSKQPGGGEDVWCFRARTALERELWVKTIQRVVALIQRVEMAPTLVGVGAIDYHYDLKQDIGVGRFGTVKLAVARATGNLFAVKVINRAKYANTPDALMAVSTELRVVRKVTRMHEHPNICKTFHSFSENQMVFIVMEYLAGGSLQERIRKRGHYQEAEASNVVFQVASALKELHSSGIVLCDIHPGNLLYESPDDEIIKVAEFGRALIMPGPAFASQTRQPDASTNSTEAIASDANRRRRSAQAALSSFVTNQQIIGLPGYIAPEILSHKQYSTDCDVFALGCVTFSMLTGVSPLLGPDKGRPPSRSALDQVLSDANVSLEARDLIAGMTNPDRSKRLSATQVLEHVWVLAPPRRFPYSDTNMPFPRSGNATMNDVAVSSPPRPSRMRLLRLIHAVHFSVRLFRLVRRARWHSGGDLVKAQPPPPLVFNMVNSRRSTDTSSGGMCQLEWRNQWLTLDGYAQRVRSENRLDELSPIFKGATNGRVNSAASGFAGVGISSSVAGQLSEMGADSAEPVRDPVRPPGPFLAALEAHLEMEAGFESSSDEETSDEDRQRLQEQQQRMENAQTAIPKSTEHEYHDKQEPLAGDKPLTKRRTEEEDDEEDEALQTPKTRRESAVRAWEAMVRESEQEIAEEQETSTRKDVGG